ncbi:TetR/AcrR family transcriptional regulator [Pseudochelatococcus sp. G4_1912]|uniref:TetR/AcrR family transcriptional regulator n=1 Tax=Pseudochelatococcus sp. G4_1912 TaxID=3114288 RepID=UPI0039C62F63
MGRHRTITREQVLEAAQAVVLRDGAGRMTLEAVALQAGISKASVLYDFKTKQQLISALIERDICNHQRKIDELAEALGSSTPDAGILARIEAVRSMTDDDRAVTTSLCAAMTCDAQLRKPLQELFTKTIEDLRTTSESPRGALLAFLAAEGLAQLEWFGFQAWQEDEREQLLADICWLSSQVPAPTLLETNKTEPISHKPKEVPEKLPID